MGTADYRCVFTVGGAVIQVELRGPRGLLTACHPESSTFGAPSRVSREGVSETKDLLLLFTLAC